MHECWNNKLNYSRVFPTSVCCRKNSSLGIYGGYGTWVFTFTAPQDFLNVISTSFRYCIFASDTRWTYAPFSKEWLRSSACSSTLAGDLFLSPSSELVGHNFLFRDKLHFESACCVIVTFKSDPSRSQDMLV